MKKSIWFKLDSNGKGVVLYNHGNAGTLSSCGHSHHHFTDLGYEVVFWDYRGFGKSSGSPTEQNIHEDADLVYHHIETNTNLPISVYGRSLGSGVAVKLASTHQVKSFILETPYKSILSVAQDQYPFLPCRLILKHTFESDLWINQVSAPVYIIHGTADRIIPYENAQELYQICGEHCSFTTIEGANHFNVYTYPLYDDFLANALSH